MLVDVLLPIYILTVVSYNLPKFSPCATWNPNATIFVNGSTVGIPFSVFVNTNNSIYVPSQDQDKVFIWDEGNNSSTRIISGGLNQSYSVFLAINGDTYVDNGEVNRRIDKWALNATNSVPVINVTSRCRSLFIDINNTLYCSYDAEHKVVKVPLSHNLYIETIAAGNGTSGSEANMLNGPKGIFVDFNLNLYVADHYNNRIQCFKPGQVNGTTVAGEGAPGTIKLNQPGGIILDADGYLFIADQENYRIIKSGPTGFRCLVGCSNIEVPQIYQLSQPKIISFDSYGNIFAVDHKSNRILKFALATNSCAVSYNQLKLSPCASWDTSATTFANITTVGKKPFGIFVNTNNTVYVTSGNLNQTVVWSETNSAPSQIISYSFNNPRGLFVTINDDIYVSADTFIYRLDKWTLNTTTGIFVMNVSDRCIGLFIDFTNTLYCSLDLKHKVVKLLLEYSPGIEENAAGNGTNGSMSYLLYYPNGIFVDISLNLYVADSGNNRIQLFRQGDINGTTVAGNNALGTIGLNFPTGIVLDADGYLFIADRDNHRIIRSELNGFRCIVGCSKHHGSASNQLHEPRALWLDSYGNMFVLDNMNNRVQKFNLSTNSCGSSSSLTALTCWSSANIGIYCNISNTPCDILKPCKNNATCNNTDDNQGYICSCLSGFNGTHCEFDYQPCKPNTCWNNGICNETSNTTFKCTCAPGWEGRHCEKKINYCHNITCQNKGVCRPLLLNYSCECLGDSYSGRHCEITATKIVIYKIVSKSFAYIAIIAMISVAIFIIVMGILKYVFGIDPTREELERIRREKQAKKRKALATKSNTTSSTSSSTVKRISTIETTL